jgi:hypothetical protein
VQLWDTATGKVLRRLSGQALPAIGAPAFSSDGRMLACITGAQVCVWYVDTGELLNRFGDKDGTVNALAFSPDDTTLATADAAGGIRLWEMYTGQERARLKVTGSPLRSIAFSPGGELLAAGGDDETIHIWSLRQGKEVCQCSAKSGTLASLTFSPSGNALAAGTADANALSAARLAHEEELHLLDNAPVSPGSFYWKAPAPNNWTPPGTDHRAPPSRWEAWDALGEADAARAYKAVWALAGERETAVAMLADDIRPIRLAGAQEIDQLVTALASPRPGMADAAVEKLEELAETAVVYLRKKLQGEFPPEARNRLEQVLASLEGRAPSKRQLRAWRAIEVLEHSNTVEGWAKLAALAEGAPAARQTQRARAALQRRDQLVLAGLMEK